MKIINSKIIWISVIVIIFGGVFAGYWQKKENNTLRSEKYSLENSLTKLENEKKPALIVVFGDTRTGHDIHRKIVSKILQLNPEAVFHVGDMVADGNDQTEWDIFNGIESKLIASTNFYTAAGNHEKESDLYYNNFAVPGNEKWYSVNYLGIHFSVINSNLDLSPASDQYKWLESDLATERENIKYDAIVMHAPLYSSGKHGGDADLAKDLDPLIKKYGVDVVFAGHDHDYERSYKDGTYYLTCGSAGAPLYEETNKNAFSQKFLSSYNYCVVQNMSDNLEASVYNEKGNLIDQIQIN